MEKGKYQAKLVRESNRLYTVDNCLISNAIILHDTVYCLSNENPKLINPCELCALRTKCIEMPAYRLCDIFNAKQNEYIKEIGELFHPF